MKIFKSCLSLLLLPPALLWAQTDKAPADPPPAAVGPLYSGDAMLTPPPVSGQSFPTALTSEERSNYLRGGVAFTSAYTDNAVGSSNGTPVSDVSYSVAPFVTLDETTSRMHALVSYAPGFTFYQRISSLNESDENASINLAYRLSPHVTLSGQDGLQKSSNVFNQPDLASAVAVSGATQAGNFSVIAPISDRLSNSGNVGITAQMAANGMVGASGTFVNLRYLDQAQVPGLYDTSSQAGEAFYSQRLSQIHYVGVSYQYQRLLSYPAQGQNETQTQAALFFYTLYPNARFSISVFGGPQYADQGPQFFGGATPAAGSRSWNPAAGGSVNWQGPHSAVAFSYSHVIANGGGLIGAVKMDGASASFRQQLTRSLNATLGGGFAQNDVLTATPAFSENGHTVSGTAVVQQLFRQHWSVQLGYTRLHEDYSAVAVLAQTPNTNREFVAISYQFARPLGR